MDEHKLMYDLLQETRTDVKELKDSFNTHVLDMHQKLNNIAAPQTAFRVLSNTAAKIGGILGLILTIAAIVNMVKHEEPKRPSHNTPER